MYTIIAWFVLSGALLLMMALFNSYISRLPLTAAIFYLSVGLAIGPYGLGLLVIDNQEHARILEHLTEIAVVVALFTAGLKLHHLSTGPLWRIPISLATIGVLVSVMLVAFLTNTFLGWSWGAAILLGAILSPTDPVLASDVQVEKAHDRDRLRFGLTGEGCLNDGSAFPFVMLALGLLGLHEIGSYGSRWVMVDLIWACVGGLGIGYGLGKLIGHAVLFLRQKRKLTVDVDEFLALGLIALSYGVALAAHTYGFLAVFAAGFALRSLETKPVDPEELEGKKEDAAQDPDKGPSYLSHALLNFNKQLERIFEVVIVVIFGALFRLEYVNWTYMAVALALFILVRPISAAISIGAEKKLLPIQKLYIYWFGVRGVGSLYYYFYAVNKGLDPSLAETIMGITYCSVVLSIVVHGISVTPLMNFYEKRHKSGSSATTKPAHQL